MLLLIFNEIILELYLCSLLETNYLYSFNSTFSFIFHSLLFLTRDNLYLIFNKNSKNCANSNTFEKRLLIEGSSVISRQFVFRKHRPADGA